jgi:hypothetical protein
MTEMTTKKTPQQILDDIEPNLIAEGLITPEPTASRCDGCGVHKLDCRDQEGLFVEGNFCTDCWAEVDRVQCFVGETGKAVQRYLRDGGRHFVFLEPGKEPGKLLMITAKNLEEMPYFDPTGIGEDKLQEQLRLDRLKFS